MSIPSTCEVLIIGGGVAGAGAAYYLSALGVQNIVVIDAGTIGNGSTQPSVVSNSGTQLDSNVLFNHASRSGSAVMESASCIKMIIPLFASTCNDFIHHHGKEGAKSFLKLCSEGLTLQKDLAVKLLPSPETQFREVGSLYLAYAEDRDDLFNEFNLFRELGFSDVEWWDKAKLELDPGCPDIFDCGIYFPGTGIINSTEYAKSLLVAAVATNGVQIFENSPSAISVTTKNDSALTELSNGARIVSKYAIVATGGLLTESTLSGVLRPCWSYLVSVPHPHLSSPAGITDGTPMFSNNMFTWGFTHDWCWTNGAVRLSGEDHFSALKAPRDNERCATLSQFVRESYPKAFSEESLNYEQQYGVYSETTDGCPLIGTPNDRSKVCYLLGCNAWGQSVLSYAVKLVPGILGYRELSEDEKEKLQTLSIRRYCLLPIVRDVA